MSDTMFISHSSEDEHVARELLDLIELSVDGLSADAVRYTGRHDTGLVPGDRVSELFQDIKRAACTVAIVSDSYVTSDYCNAEWGAAAVSDGHFLAGRLAGIEPATLGGPFSGRNFVDLRNADAVRRLLNEVSESSDEWRWRAREEKIKQFCLIAARHLPNPIERFRKRLVKRLATGEIFVNGYGLFADPGARSVFQDFHPVDANIQPVQYLWADPRLGNTISAELQVGPEPASSFIRIVFDNRPGSLGCNVGFRPLNREALLTAGAQTLIIEGRVPEDSELLEVGIVPRAVNGYMQHWQSTRADMISFQKGEFRPEATTLDPVTWALFDSDGTGQAGPTSKPDFSIIASINLSLGGYVRLGSTPIPGEGLLDIREIRVE